MKFIKFFVLAFILIFYPNISFSKIISINKFLNGSNYQKDIPTEYYTLNRCNAVFISASSIFAKKKNKKMQLKLKGKAKIITTKIMILYTKKNKIKMPTDMNDPIINDMQQELLNIQKKYIDFYVQKENYEQKGNKHLIKGIFLEDVKFCNSIN